MQHDADGGGLVGKVVLMFELGKDLVWVELTRIDAVQGGGSVPVQRDETLLISSCRRFYSMQVIAECGADALHTVHAS